MMSDFHTPRAPRSIRLALVAVLAVGAAASTLLSAPAAVYAQDAEAQVERLIEEAAGHYDMLELQKAKSKLQEAIRKGDAAGVSDAVLARAYVMQGIVRFGGSRDKQATEQAFINALETDADAQIPDVYQTPTLEKIWASAEQKAEPPADDKPAGDARQVDSFTHEPIATTDAGEPMLVEAFVPADMAVARVFVAFSRYNSDEWHREDLQPTDATRYSIELNGERIYTSQISYYVAAVNDAGNVVARSGSRRSPHAITVLGSSDYTPPGDDDTDGDDTMAGGDNGDGTGDGSGDGTGDDTGDEPVEPRKKGKVGFVGLKGGTGIGFLPGGEPTANPNRDVKPGVAPAFGHIQLEGGYQFSSKAQLGLYFRYQFSPTQDFDEARSDHRDRFDDGEEAFDPARLNGFTDDECFGLMPGDCLLGLRYKYFFTDSYGFRAFSSVGAGVGRVRHWLRLKERADDPFCEGKETIDPSDQDAFCYRRDTVRPGFVHFGAGGGFAWDFNETFSLLGEAYLQVLFPDTAINLDITLGPQVRF